MGKDPGLSDGPDAITRVLDRGIGRQMSKSGGDAATEERQRCDPADLKMDRDAESRQM